MDFFHVLSIVLNTLRVLAPLLLIMTSETGTIIIPVLRVGRLWTWV